MSETAYALLVAYHALMLALVTLAVARAVDRGIPIGEARAWYRLVGALVAHAARTGRHTRRQAPYIGDDRRKL